MSLSKYNLNLSTVDTTKQKYYKTKWGIINRIYDNQIRASIKRKHDPPSYSKEDLADWLFGLFKFHKLFKDWVDSGYLKELVPSVDRQDDCKGYTLSNIQLMTWRENRLKEASNRKYGINKKVLKAVIQCDLKGNYIDEFYSMKNAERLTGANQGHVSEVCLGKRRQEKGCIWKFKN